MSSSESDVDRLRRNDPSLKAVCILERSDAVEILDALKDNTIVKQITFDTLQLNREALVKLSEVMKCNTSVDILSMSLFPLERGRLLRETFFETMATSGGWLSIQELDLTFVIFDRHVETKPLSITDLKHISSFIIQSENLRTLSLHIAADDAAPIVETLSRTNVKTLWLNCSSNFSAETGGRQLATALERCTCITKFRLGFGPSNHQVEMECLQILFLKSIPKMLGLKKLLLEINDHVYQEGFFDIVGQCIEGHQGVIEELELTFESAPVNLSIVGLAPALRRLKVIVH